MGNLVYIEDKESTTLCTYE